jgi:hypothetical protein
MKTKTLSIITILFVLVSEFVYSQGFQPPAPGKAVIYFVRPKDGTNKQTFLIFDNDKLIGEIEKNVNYLRIEFEPGKHLFWASGENKQFIEADLKAGETYIIKCTFSIGGFTSTVWLTPVKSTNKELFEQTKAIVLKQAPLVNLQSFIDRENSFLKSKIERNLASYKSGEKGGTNINTLTKEMVIPVEELK